MPAKASAGERSRNQWEDAHARRKMQISWADTHALLAMLRGLVTAHPLTKLDWVLPSVVAYRPSMP